VDSNLPIFKLHGSDRAIWPTLLEPEAMKSIKKIRGLIFGTAFERVD
jgi:hypothetical protein